MPANDPPKKLQLAVAVAAALAVCAAATSEFPIEPGVKLWGLNPGHDGHPETPQPSGPLAKQDQMTMGGSTTSQGLPPQSTMLTQMPPSHFAQDSFPYATIFHPRGRWTASLIAEPPT